MVITELFEEVEDVTDDELEENEEVESARDAEDDELFILMITNLIMNFVEIYLYISEE